MPLHRLRRVAAGRVDRLYTISDAERAAAIARYGCEPEGVAGLVYDGQAPGTVPWFRLWHGPSQTHAYTAVPSVLARAVAAGTYRAEGAACYVFDRPDPAGATVPLYALARRATHEHLYTADPAERDAAIAAGYEALGISCWLDPAS